LDTGERREPGRKETAAAGSEQEWTVDVLCQRDVSATQRTHQSRPHHCQWTMECCQYIIVFIIYLHKQILNQKLWKCINEN